jgi:tRNA(fMet)-specific endonuclease VapC
MRFLLDTNAVSDLVRNPQGKCATRIAAIGENEVLTSIIVASELRYGALKKNSIRLTRQLETILSVLEVAPFEAPADTVYAKVRAQLEAAGTPIGGNDLLIASHAVALGLTLVTDNEREFARVRELKLENWLQSR